MMEKAMTLVLMVLMLWQMSSLQNTAWTPNRLAVLREAAGQSTLVVDGVVLEAWTPKASQRAVEELEKSLGLTQLTVCGQQSLGTDGVIKLRRDGQAVTVQMIFSNVDEAEVYYQTLARWMSDYGQGQPAGATLLAHAEEALSPQECQALSAELIAPLPARLVSTIEEGTLVSSTYQVAGVEPCLEIAGEKINVNVACVAQEKKTAIYLGAPVIYQQY